MRGALFKVSHVLAGVVLGSFLGAAGVAQAYTAIKRMHGGFCELEATVLPGPASDHKGKGLEVGSDEDADCPFITTQDLELDDANLHAKVNLSFVTTMSCGTVNMKACTVKLSDGLVACGFAVNTSGHCGDSAEYDLSSNLSQWSSRPTSWPYIHLEGASATTFIINGYKVYTD